MENPASDLQKTAIENPTPNPDQTAMPDPTPNRDAQIMAACRWHIKEQKKITRSFVKTIRRLERKMLKEHSYR